MLLFSEGGHHTPIVVEFINHYLGEPVNKFELAYTKPVWDKIFKYFGTDAEKVFGPYTAENAIPWYTVMFVIACLLTIAVIWILKGKLSEDSPTNGQLTLEAGFLTLREMLTDIVGDHGMKYFPVVATFAILILISNLMGFFPLFMAPTASTSVTFALGISSFVYYNYVGIRENGIVAHLSHLAGPIWWMAWFIFPLELISNFIRPLSLSIRLFGNIFADEQVAATVSGLGHALGLPDWTTQLLLPLPLMALGLLVCLVQTFVFTLLSMIYLSEVSHGDHGHDHDEEHAHEAHAEVAHA
ncbi:MAG TPA: F0F1 ATP synthase subunit A [Pyrinomonadaceae bacterium]|nr:F0F1 ATP synthase subunit A [Pyrinomonadaceae bacterium]